MRIFTRYLAIAPVVLNVLSIYFEEYYWYISSLLAIHLGVLIPLLWNYYSNIEDARFNGMFEERTRWINYEYSTPKHYENI